MDADGHAACRQLVKQITRADGLFRCRPALPATGAVAAGAEALLHRPLIADQHKRIASHVAGDEHWLTHGAILRGYSRMFSWKCTSRSFAMNAEALQLPIDLVLLDLGDVMAYIVDKRHLLGARLATEDAGERLAYSLHQE